MGKLTQTTAEVQSLLDKVAAGADAQLSMDSTNAVQNKTVTQALNKKVGVSTTINIRSAEADGFIRNGVKYNLPGVTTNDGNTLVTMDVLDEAVQYLLEVINSK